MKWYHSYIVSVHLVPRLPSVLVQMAYTCSLSMQCVSTVSSLWIYRIKMMLHARLHASPSKLMIVYDLERIKKAPGIFQCFHILCVFILIL